MMIQIRRRTLLQWAAILACSSLLRSEQSTAKPESAVASVRLQVSEGTPLRLFLSRRIWYRNGAPVSAQVIEPLWAFDRIVVPAGTTVWGHIAALHNVSRRARTTALLNGDFTPLKQALVVFTDMRFPDGQNVRITTQPSIGLPTLYLPQRQRAKKKREQQQAETNSRRAKTQRQVGSQIKAQSSGVIDFVRGPNKKEWVEDFLLGKLPYHPQWYRARTRFDAELKQPLDFGATVLPAHQIRGVGALPATEALAQLRLLSPVTSATARSGDPVEAVLSRPVYSSDHQLVLPEGTRFSGKVTLAQRARSFHRGGKVRFAFDRVDAPAGGDVPSEEPVRPVQSQLTAIEANPNALQVDGEGTAKATESKTRFLRPVLAGLIAANSADAGIEPNQGITATTGGGANLTGRTLGGFSGFGLLGTAASFGPRAIGAALGYYGLAWSVYSNVIARGAEAAFARNTAMQIRFGAARHGQ